MGDHKGCAALHKIGKAFLNQLLRFGIQTGSRLVENKNARISQDGAGDGDALALSTGQLHAPFANDGVISVFKTFREFVYTGDTTGAQDLFFRGVGTRKCYVLANSTVEQERILQDHSKMRTVRIQPDRREVGAINQDFSCFRDVEGGNQTYDSRLS